MLKADDPSIVDGAGDAIHFRPRPTALARQAAPLQLADGPVFSACAGACLYRVSAFRDVGGFDERFFMYSEDSDLGLRLQLAGFPCRFVARAVVQHLGSATTGGHGSDFCVFYGNRNVVWLTLKLSLCVAACRYVWSFAALGCWPCKCWAGGSWVYSFVLSGQACSR